VAARQLIPPADPLSGQAIGRRRLSRGVESSEAPLRRTDVTEHPTAEGEVHLCAIKDLHSGRIVGCSMGARMTAAPAVTAPHDAIALRSRPAPSCTPTAAASSVAVVVARDGDRAGAPRSVGYGSARRSAHGTATDRHERDHDGLAVWGPLRRT
jgi:transposase InsO family protein